MLRLLQSLFSTTPTHPGKFDAALIRGAIERVVGGTDPRLRMASQYQKKLWPAVERSMDYVNALVDSLPPPVEIGGCRFTTDPRLRALFASTKHLQEILSFGQELHQYRRRIGGGLPLSLIHISEPTRLRRISYAVFCL